MLKKMTMLAMAVGALVAFAVPATASAVEWTDNDNPLGEGNAASQSFEGRIDSVVKGVGSYGCIVTVEIEAKGLVGGLIKKFNPTTATCSGSGALTGCVLTSDISNILEEEEYVWGITLNEPLEATISKTNGGELTIHNVYHGCAAPIFTVHLLIPKIRVFPTVNEFGTITALHLSGIATGETVISGSLVPDPGNAPLTLGIK